MRRFVKKCFLFLLSLLPLLLLLEWAVVRIPNSYQYKYDYVKNHGDSIETVALGYSQIYDGFMPQEYAEKTFNLANSAQYILENYYILEELLPHMPNLKTVIMPIGYTDVLSEKREWWFEDRSCFYREYMNLWFDGHLPVCYWFECFNPTQAVDKLRAYYINHEDIVKCDSLGMQQLKRHKGKLNKDNHHLSFGESEEIYICFRFGNIFS